MSKIKINRNDELRILLTELLPYEVPMLFSNDGLYSLIKNNQHKIFFEKIKSLQKQKRSSDGKGYGIPFNYEIRKTVDDTRTMSVIHPLNQYDFIEFYKKYDSLILHLCAKSPFSLRRATQVAKFCYSPDLIFQEDEHRNSEVEVEPEVLDQETRLFKSYFTYHPIDLIYKFFRKKEYQRLEQRFNLSMEFDISKCFYNIYTHTITWAVKGKEHAKINARKDSFENRFDKLMQQANYNETNGIVVGPEVSRIFAEIILQQIDINVLNKLDKDKGKWIFGIHYEIRRYVDDFFVFSNDEKILDLILKTYKKELEAYKLYINISKTQKRKAPFITSIAVGKRELEHLLSNLYNKLIETVEIKTADDKLEKKKVIKQLRNPYGLAQDFINDFKCIVKRNNLTYDFLNKDIVRDIKGIIVEVFRKDEIDKRKDVIEGFLLVLVELAFYAYSLNINASTTFKISQIVVLICKFLEGKEEDLRHSIFSKIAGEIDFSMTIFQSTARPYETNVDTLNLLVASKKLGDSYLLSDKKIRELFGLGSEERISNLNYFQIATLLYYFENNQNYNQLKTDIENAVIQKFKINSDPFTKAELTFLFFDFVCCPFVSKKSKKEVIQVSGYAKNNLDDEIDKIMKQKVWFMSWDIEVDLERVLKKKEWSSSY